jgi:hypothetical protein
MGVPRLLVWGVQGRICFMRRRGWDRRGCSQGSEMMGDGVVFGGLGWVDREGDPVGPSLDVGISLGELSP